MSQDNNNFHKYFNKTNSEKYYAQKTKDISINLNIYYYER